MKKHFLVQDARFVFLRSLILVVSLFFVITMFCNCSNVDTSDLSTETSTINGGTGSGTKSDPYTIATVTQLNAIRGGVSGYTDWSLSDYYKLIADIDLSNVSDWTSIGNSTSPFTGMLDGDGHSINNLTIGTTDDIKNSSKNYKGLFGKISNGTVKNLEIKNAVVYGYEHIGIITGDLDGSSISACYNVSCIISGQGYVGGITGKSENSSTISDCYNTANVSGNVFIGGITGFSDGSISDCYNTGSVSGKTSIGGITGSSDGSISDCYNTGTISGTSMATGGISGILKDATINKCYNTAIVSGETEIGGIVGYSNNGTTTNCYNTGSISGTSLAIGGIVGEQYNSGAITDCYNTGSISGKLSVGGIAGYSFSSSTIIYSFYLDSSCTSTKYGISKTSEELKEEDTYSNWENFSTIWYIDTSESVNDGYPYFL